MEGEAKHPSVLASSSADHAEFNKDRAVSGRMLGFYPLRDAGAFLSWVPIRWNDPPPLWRVLTRVFNPAPLKVLNERGDAVGKLLGFRKGESYADVPTVMKKLDNDSRLALAANMPDHEGGSTVCVQGK